MDKMEPAIKAFFLFTALLLWAGIWLTGLDDAHWLLYLPATFFLLASLTGICPGLIVFREIFKDKPSKYIE